jgi:tetratricopeptide (TPR) repeat protein
MHPVDKVYYENPVKIWERVTKIFPDFFRDDPDLYYFIGDCYRHLGEYEKAIQCYGIVADKWTQKGYAMVSNVVVPKADDGPGDYEAIHALFDRLVVDFGKDAGLAATILRTGYEYHRRANDARREGLSTEAQVDNLKAIALYDRVIKEFASSPFTASAYFFSALSFRDLGQWQDALHCSNHLLDNWPEYKYASWARRLAQNCSEKLAAQAQ